MPVKKRKVKKTSTKRKTKRTTKRKTIKTARTRKTSKVRETRTKTKATKRVPTKRKVKRKKKPSVGKLTYSRSIYPYPELPGEIRAIDKHLKKKGLSAGLALRPSHFTNMKSVVVVAANERSMKIVLKALQELDIVESAGSELRRIIKKKKQSE